MGFFNKKKQAPQDLQYRVNPRTISPNYNNQDNNNNYNNNYDNQNMDNSYQDNSSSEMEYQEPIIPQIEEEDTDLAPLKDSTFVKMIAVIGLGMGTGTKTIATNLALTLAKQGKNVGMLDGNFYNPSLLFSLNQIIEEKDSVVKYIQGGKELSEIFKQSTIHDNLRFISTSPHDSPAHIVDIKEVDMENIYDYLRESFDFVIIPINYDPVATWFVTLMDTVDLGFIIWDEQKECVVQTKYMLDYINKICGKSQTNKINNVIINKRTNESMNLENIDKIQCRLIAELPYLDQIKLDKNRAKIYMSDDNINRRFKKEFKYIIDSIFKNYLK